MTAITLVHNSNAGIRPIAAATVVRLLDRAGYRVHYIARRRTANLAADLAKGPPLVAVAGGDGTVAEVLRAGMDLPFACKGGMCSTCRAKLVEGDAPMELNYSLEPWELEAGFILTCQAHPASAKVVVDYDQM